MFSFGFENETILRLILAVILGALIGFERELKKKGAGLQTYSLVRFGINPLYNPGF